MAKIDNGYNYEQHKDINTQYRTIKFVRKIRNDIMKRWYDEIISNAKAILGLRDLIEASQCHIRLLEGIENSEIEERLEIEVYSLWLDIIEIASRCKEDQEFLSKERLEVEVRSELLDASLLKSHCKEEE